MTVRGGRWTALLVEAERLLERAKPRRPRGPREPGESVTPHGPLDARVATGALLLEMAYADGELSTAERRYIESTIAREFGLRCSEVRRLVRSAETARTESSATWRFAHTLVEDLSPAQRSVLSDILARLARLEGAPGRDEQYTLRKISALLRLEPEHV